MFRSMPAGELETALQGIEYVAKYARLLLRQRKRGHDESEFYCLLPLASSY
jgi:hypothetical protein